MKKIVFATNNEHKLKEVRAMMPADVEIVGLADLPFYEDIPETANSLEGNAIQKAQYIYHIFGCDCFADDTGLEVTALDGRPGVHTARYAGITCNSSANIHKLLGELVGKTDRTARFRTVIALIINGEEYTFEGIVNGQIATKPSGKGGFGYDPVFIPDDMTQTFAELGDKIKNAISHRAQAIKKLVEFLSQTNV